MDKVIKITLGVFIIVFVAFVATVSYIAYIDNSYTNSLTGNYLYTCTISTNDILSNVTLFLPVPENEYGASPVISQISAQMISGVPEGWNLTLFDTGKTTLLEISAKTIGKSQTKDTLQSVPVTLIVNVTSHHGIDTKQPIDKSAVFRPVEGLISTSCPTNNVYSENSPVCYEYQTSAYADYMTAPSTNVTISESVIGTNSWNIFSPAANQYIDQIYLPHIQGSNHGWVTAKGWIETGIGSYFKEPFS